MNDNEIMVSINCITYNHEKYIKKTIESFLEQKTNFKFEVLIHDDASIDGTQEIIRNYQKMYPNIIKPILQKENQYSKGIRRIWHVYNEKRAKGKYIALCEGDDYWTDPYKLQKQVDYMENNPECSMCFHAANILNDAKGEVMEIFRSYDRDCIAPIEDIITGGGGFCATASLLYRTKLVENLPEFYFESHVGDYPNQMILASKGYAYYVNEPMCTYRVNVKGSWTDRQVKSKNVNDSLIKNSKNDIYLLNKFNEFTEYKYSCAVEKKILECNFYTNMLEGNKKKLKVEYLDLYNELKLKDKFKFYIRRHFPYIDTILYENIILYKTIKILMK